jgi:SAM-dependent methyltransferase
MSEVRERVREKYAEAARQSGGGSCGCRSSGCCDVGTSDAGVLYGDLTGEVTEAAALASLGCGNPVAVAELRAGEVVLDLGSGGGIDVILSAKRVGSTGMAYGLDMTEEMLDLARRNAAEAAVTNVEFLKGFIEDVPLPAGSVDVIISNCVINLSADKPRVFDEMARVLRAGGRLGISDIVAGDDLTPEQRAERGSWVGCIAGALSFEEYEAELRRAGFADIRLSPTHEVADGIFSAIVRATKPFPPSS